MHLASILSLGLGMSTTASAYVLTLYSGPGCTGNHQRRNIRDNSCAMRKDNFLARSARVEKYGGWGQNARFHIDKGDGTCVLATVFRGPWDAHKANYSWKEGNCLEFDGTTAYAFGSFAV